MPDRVIFSESEDQWLYEIDKSEPLINQVVFESSDHYLLNVTKVYTNDKYFGMLCSCLLKKSKEFYNIFRCKDRGFTESLVDNKDFFILKYKDLLVDTAKDLSNKTHSWQSEKADFLDEYNVNFVFDEKGNYKHSTAYVNNVFVRGVYGIYIDPTDNSPDALEDIDNMYKEHDFLVVNRLPTETEVFDNLIKKQLVSTSNTITRENTSYSKIKIYHKTEIKET